MTTFVEIAIRSSGVLLLGLSAAAVLRHRSAALRHIVLAASIFAAALIVPVGRVIPGWNLPAVESVSSHLAPASDTQASVMMSATRELDSAEGFALPIVVSLWAGGCVIAIALLVVRILQLVRMSARATPVVDSRWVDLGERISQTYRLRRRLRFLRTDVPDVIATWGFFAPRVLLPRQSVTWSDDRIQTVLCHELAHVRRFDWIVQISAEAVRAVYWFNPLVWIACRRLRHESEHACDDVVLAAGVSATNYAAHLLALAHACRPARPYAAATPMARRSTLERRIAAMLNSGLDHRAPSYRAVVATLVLLLTATLPIAVLRGEQTALRPLTGAIYDSTGAVLPGVTVTLQDDQTFKWEATTDASGQFEFPPVQPGRYVLEVSLMGFRNLRHEVDLQAPRDWVRAITMPVGELSETVTVSASRAARPNQPQGPTPVRVGGNIKVPLKIVNVNPVYPTSMREAGLSGLVPIEAIIGIDGFVLSARVRGAHVHPDFAKAALDAVRQWQFTPTLLNGAPVEVAMNVSVKFELAD